MSDWDLIRNRDEWCRHVQRACREMAGTGDVVAMDEPEGYPVLVRRDVQYNGECNRIEWVFVYVDDAARLLDATVPEGPATRDPQGVVDLLQRMAVGNEDVAHEVQIGERVYGMDGLDLVIDEPGGGTRKTGISLRPLARLCYADALNRTRRKMGET